MKTNSTWQGDGRAADTFSSMLRYVRGLSLCPFEHMSIQLIVTADDREHNHPINFQHGQVHEPEREVPEDDKPGPGNPEYWINK